MEYPYLGFKNADGSGVVSKNSIIVFFTSKNHGVIVHNIDESDNENKFGKYTEFNEDEFYFYPEENTVVITN